jgi:hypothetical protein
VEPRLAEIALLVLSLHVPVLPGTMAMPLQVGAVLSAGPTVLLSTVIPMQEPLRTACAMPVIMAAAARVLP